MKFNCIIVDEDAHVRQDLEDYITALQGIVLSAPAFSDVTAAGEFLRNNNTDIIFTDIKTLDFINRNNNSFIQPPPAIVFTANDPADAHIGFDLDAVDCLVKPFSFERFLKTVEKIQRRLYPLTFKNTITTTSHDPQYCFVKTDQNFTKVEFSKINYVEGLENYVRIYCENKTVLALSTMKNLEAALSSYHFLRIHRSYLVNLDKVDSVLNYNFYVGDKVLPIGRSYRKSITDVLKQEYTFRS